MQNVLKIESSKFRGRFANDLADGVGGDSQIHRHEVEHLTLPQLAAACSEAWRG